MTLRHCIALILLLGWTACQQPTSLETEDPVEYNSFIENEMAKTSKAIMNFAGALAIPGIAPETLRQQHAETLKKVQECLSQVENMASFKGDRQYRIAATALIRFYERKLRREYSEFVELMTKPDKGPDDLQRMDQISVGFAEEERQMNEAFVKAQQEFSQQYGLGQGLAPASEEDYKTLK